MIVIDPPAVPAFVPSIASGRAEDAAIEWALYIARVPYSCRETAGPVEWLRCLRQFGTDTTFVVHGEHPFPIAVLRSDDVSPDDRREHFVANGLSGVLEAAAMITKRVEAMRSATTEASR